MVQIACWASEKEMLGHDSEFGPVQTYSEASFAEKRQVTAE
jgi:hypothetical protein